MRELLLGCGPNRDKRLIPPGRPRSWENLTTLDINPAHNPDVVHDLETLPYPFPGSHFREIHAYEVLEHLGRQGDYRALFAQFSEFWRLLEPDGAFCAMCPSYRSMWAWGDPSHTRVITSGTLAFLSQRQYRSQVDGNPGPKSAMSDFRPWYSADFEILRTPEGVALVQEDDEVLWFMLRAVKSGT